MFPSSSYDQPIRQIEPADVALFDEVDKAVAESTVVGDPSIACDFGLSLIRSGLLRAHALAKLLYKIRSVWELFYIEEPFEDVVFERMGVAKATVDKYVKMWEAIFENNYITQDTKQKLMGRPIRDLLMLTAAAREGSLDDEGLMRAADAPDRASIREIIRDARGEATSSGSALIGKLVWRDDATYPKGTLLAMLEGQTFEAGWLDVNSTEDAVQRLIERIRNNTPVSEA